MSLPAPTWVVMIEEETNRQQNGRQVLPGSLAKSFPDEERARDAAWDLAHTHRPRHPMSPQSRTVVQHSDNDYTVVVLGATQKPFHFRVRVGRVYGDQPGDRRSSYGAPGGFGG